MTRPDPDDIEQYIYYNDGRSHHCVPLLFVADVANWLPEVNIFAHALTAHAEYVCGQI